jgi:hypothetical protein
MEEKIEELIARMKAAGEDQDFIDATIAKLRGQPAPASEPEEKHVALTVADASAEDISAVSIDTDYWAKVKKEQGITREAVMADKNKYEEHAKQIAEEKKIAESVKTSGSKSEETTNDSNPMGAMPNVADIEFAKVKDSEATDYRSALFGLRDKYARWGFDINNVDASGHGIVTGLVSVSTAFDGGKEEETKTFDLSDAGAKKAMDVWMRERAVDKYADYEKSLEGVKITTDDRKKAAEESKIEFDNLLKEAQDLEAAQAWKEGDEPLENNKYHEQIQYACSASTIRETGRAQCDKLMAMKPSDIGKIEITKGFLGVTTGWKHINVTGADELTQARLSIAERAFREELEGLTPKEKKDYRLTKKDRDQISADAEGIDRNDPEVRRIATDILSTQKEQGLLASRVADKASAWGDGKIGDFDQEVIEAIGKEKLEKLNKKQKATLGEYQVIKEKHTAIKGLFEASGEALKNYDAQGKIETIMGRGFKTQEEVDAAKSEIADIVARHERLAADYSNKLRNYELITDATIKASEKVGGLQLDIEDVGSYTQLVGLDYSLLHRMGEALGNAGIDLVQGAVSAGELVVDAAKWGIMTSGHPVMSGMLRAYENSGDGGPSAMEKAHAAVDAYQAEWSDSMYHMQYDDIDSASDFGEWFAVMMAGQVPNLALMSVAGPASLYAMGITSTGQKYLALKAQNKLYAESGGLYGNNYSFGEMFLNATVSGAAEALSEKITLGQVNAAKGVFKGMLKNKGVRAGVVEYLTKNVFTSKALMATGKDLLEEGTSEAIATISGNLMDIWAGNREAGFWDGVEESFVSGVMMSGALKSPVLANHALSAFTSPDTDAIRDANLTRINELSSNLLGTSANRKLHGEELSEEAREVMETELAELVAETTEMLEKDIKIVDALSEDDKKKLLGLEKGKNKIRAQWESVKNDDTLSETEKEAIKDRLTKKMMANNATKAEMLSQYTPEAADIKYSETTMPLKSPDQQLEENIEFAKKHSALYGLEVDDTMSPQEIEAHLLKNGYSSKDAADGRIADGFIVGDKIIINREVAAKTGAVTVGSHELLHGILKKAMNVNKDLSTKIISQLKKEIGSQWSAVQDRIDANYSPEYMAKNPDEYLTLVSDAIANNEITYEETVFDKIRDTFNEMGLFKKAGFTKIKFKTGKDVYRFLREYNKSVHKGALSGRIVEATKGQGETAETGDLTYSMTSDQKKTAAKNVKELGAKNTNKSWRKGGADAAIKEMKDQKYFDGLIASKYKVKPVPRDFVEKVYSEITAHIKRFKPEQNDDLFAYINSQITNKAGSVYNREYKVDEAMKGSRDIDAKTAEGTPVIQIAAETESSMEAFEDQDMSMAAQSRRTKLVEQGKAESDQYSGLRTELGLEKSMMDKVRKAVTKTFGTKLPDINSKKFKAALQKAYRTELKKPIQDMIGKGEAYNEFLSKNFPIVYKFLPKETLLQMERSVPPDQRIFTKSERIIKTAEVDRLISEGLLPKETNRLSGPTLITKLPYPGSKKVMAYFRGKGMEDALGYKVGASTLGTRKDKLAMEMGVELGFDATMETVQDPEVADRLRDIEDLQGYKRIDNHNSVLAKQIDRDPSIKFSKTLKKGINNAGLSNSQASTVLENDSPHQIEVEHPSLHDAAIEEFENKYKPKEFVNLQFLGQVARGIPSLAGFIKNKGHQTKKTVNGEYVYDVKGLTNHFNKYSMGALDFIPQEIGVREQTVKGNYKFLENGVLKGSSNRGNSGHTLDVRTERRDKFRAKVAGGMGTNVTPATQKLWDEFMEVEANLELAESTFDGPETLLREIKGIQRMDISAKEKVKLAQEKLNPKALDAAQKLFIAYNASVQDWVNHQVNTGKMTREEAIEYVIRDKQKNTNFNKGERAMAAFTSAYFIDDAQDVKSQKGEHVKDSATTSAQTVISIYNNTVVQDSPAILKGFEQSLIPKELANRMDVLGGANSPLGNLRFILDPSIGKNVYDLASGKSMYNLELEKFTANQVQVLNKIHTRPDSRVMDKAIKASRSSTKKLIDGLAENDLSDAVSGINPDEYSNIRFSKSHRAEYEKRLLKKNADIGTAKQAAAHIDALFNWVDSPKVPVKKKSKFEKLALHYMVNNKLRMPEDGYKVIEAERLAEAKKIDPFSFKNPNEIIERYAGEVTKKNPNPDQHLKENDSIGAFSNKRELKNGVTMYDVENSSPGMLAVRNMVNEHFGKKSNPWCITQAIDGEVTPTAKEYWDQYGTKQILFKDGKLLAMRTESVEGALTDAGDIEFWSRDNVKFNEIPGNDYVDEQGREIRSSFNEKTGEDSGIIYGATKGSIESGKIEIYDTWIEGSEARWKARLKETGIRPQLYLEQVERYNKKGQLHGTQEQHISPAELETGSYTSSTVLTKEYKNGDFIGSRTDYGDGQGLGTFQEKLDSRLQKLSDDRAAQREGNIMFSKSSKGITVLDFDDTLATTKSGVKARIPNPDGTPKPGRKVIFMAGGAGSGKGNVIGKLGLKEAGYKLVNSDISLEWLKKNHGLPENQSDYTAEQRSQLSKLSAEARKIAKRKQGKFAGNGDGVVVDGTGGSIKMMGKLVEEFKAKGYDVSMVFVETSLEVAQQRNADRKERSLREGILNKNHEQVQGNKEAFKALFGETFNEVSTDKIGLDDALPKRFKDKVDDFTNSYENRRLDAEEFARDGADIKSMGGKFDFSEFNQVVEGETAPLFNKAMKLSGKFGTDNMFILTARSPEAAPAIKEFLDAQGLNIPLKNITGLAQSEASAKANWIAEKVGEGYNDFYFADDAMPNVKAVKDMLDQFDVKGKVQQAKLKFSKSAPKKMSEIIDEGSMDLNTILEQTKGVDRKKVFSAAKARKRGKNKGKFKFFVPPSADDFAGLMYAFMGKGKQGEQHHQFFKENLFDPFSKGIRHLKQVQQAVANDLKELRKAMPDVRKKLDKTVPGTEYTHEDAIRVYNWVKAGFEVPGLSKTDKQALVDAVTNDASLSAFAQGINAIGSTPGGLVDPGKHWLGGNIALDLKEALDVARGTYLQQWKENVDIMFNEANLNKIEAVYGSNFREALEDSLWRMEHGGNRSRGSGRLLTNFTNWIHGSIGTTMFLNARSAMLQMISSVNFVNWSDNNMVAAAKAFGNQKQYWGDVSMIFNSDFLKQRRSGIQTDVNAAELLAQIKDSKNQVKAATAYLLQLGFTPTQIADSFAIATGGATFYRNRMKTYLKEGMTQAEAETKAFEDMMEIAEETQQSTREDKISQQQASPLGKFILAFQNTPMQYNRLIKKAALDLVNGRGDPKANISRIVYYGGIQNLIFYGLQTAVFAALFSDDEEDQLTDKKSERIMNGMVDTLLRGSGIGGAVVATVKNVIIKFMKEEEKEKDDNFMTRANHASTLIEALNISPPIGIKARKLYGATQTWDFNRDVIKHMSKTDIDNPAYDAISSVTEAVTNIPLSRLYSKYQNISESLNADNEMWQRVAMFLGWNKWSFGIKNQDVVTAKGEVKEIKAVEAEERREMKKRAKDAEKQAEEEIVIESNLLDQKEEREEGQEDIKCASVSKSGARCGIKVKGGGNFCTVHEKAPQQASGEKVQCSHVKPNGDRCKMQTGSQSGKCYYHD